MVSLLVVVWVNATGSLPSFDDGAETAKIMAGYNIGIVPLVDVSIEGTCYYLGESESGGNKVDGSAMALSALAGLNLGPVGLFAKGGVADWEVKIANFPAADETDPIYGVGASFKLGSIGLRAEYEWIDASGVDLTFTTLSATYTF